MVAATNQRQNPLGLVVTGEAETWRPALDRIVGPQVVTTYSVRHGQDLLKVVSAGLADAAVVDDTPELGVDVLQLLRAIRRMNATLPVVVLTHRRDRLYLEQALRLAAFSVVVKPLELEGLLRQLHRMMDRLDKMLREDARP